MSAECDHTPSTDNSCKTSCCCHGLCPSAETWAMLGLRLFLGLRFLFAGLLKFSGIDRKLAFDHYYNGFVRIELENFSHTILPNFLTWPYLHTIAYVEIGLGAAILLGIKSKCSLAMTLLTYVSIAFGMMLLPQGTPGITVIAIHIILTVAALLLVKHNRFELWKG